jgi:small subunit ribosomal protein S11
MAKNLKIKKEVTKGRIYIKSSFNNTLITITDEKGDVIAWDSAGTAGFAGARKSTPYAAQVTTKRLLDRVKDRGLREVSVFVSGVGTGRDSAIRALGGSGLKITKIADVTPIPHNGPTPPKPRRV